MTEFILKRHLKQKPLKSKISGINQSKEIRDGLEIKMTDGKYVSFSIYNSYKVKQITEFIANYIANHGN